MSRIRGGSGKGSSLGAWDIAATLGLVVPARPPAYWYWMYAGLGSRPTTCFFVSIGLSFL